MDSAEQRAPTRISFEKQEEDEWAQRIRETGKQKYNDYSLGLTQEQVQRLRNTAIGKKQMDYHDRNEELVSTGEIVRFADGEIFLAILTDGIEDIWGAKQAAEIVTKFDVDMAVFRGHYPPGPPKHEDKRFKESYERIFARCTPLNYKVSGFIVPTNMEQSMMGGGLGGSDIVAEKSTSRFPALINKFLVSTC